MDQDQTVSEQMNGMTLLEVVVAMGLVFVALLALAGLATTAIKATASGKHLTVAATLAQEKLEEFKSAGYQTQVVGGWESVEAYGTLMGYFPYKRIVRIQSQVPMAGLQTITVTVSWANDQHAVILSTMVAQ